jgi:DNA-binding response OmpR family regulator
MSAEQPRSEKTGTARTIVLIIEDERSIASFVAEVVDDAGYLPVVAMNGLEALERAREHWPNLVITDLMMPRLDGAGVVRALRLEAATRSYAMPPVILMTAADLHYARATGADALLRKPFDLTDLDALLHRFLG